MSDVLLFVSNFYFFCLRLNLEVRKYIQIVAIVYNIAPLRGFVCLYFTSFDGLHPSLLDCALSGFDVGY